jgi:hypothetical protein
MPMRGSAAGVSAPVRQRCFTHHCTRRNTVGVLNFAPSSILNV